MGLVAVQAVIISLVDEGSCRYADYGHLSSG